MQIFPSIICGNILNLEKEILTLESICDGYHIDVMDDHFVPNLTIGPEFVNAITKKTVLPCQVHLMVDNPASWPDRLNLKEKDTFIFHAETISSKNILIDLVNKIRSKNWRVGLALNPATNIGEILPIIPALDQILIMSVNPGFSGQKFIPETVEKIKKLANIKQQYQHIKIAIDGGIDKSNIKMLAALGVDVFCVGSTIFASSNPKQALQELRDI